MDKIFIVVLLVLSNIAISQEGYPKISFELGYNHQHTDMTKFNHHLDLIKTDLVKLDNRINYVNNYTLEIKVKPISLFDFGDRKSTRLNSSHVRISYAVFCLKKKKK